MIKHQFASLALSSFVAADAGDKQSQYDARFTALFTAAYHALKDGQKSQILYVQSAAETYATPKACLEKAGNKAAAARMAKTYRAYGAAIAFAGIPAKLKGTVADVEQHAEAWAIGALTVFDSIMAPAPRKAKVDAPSKPETTTGDTQATDSVPADDTAQQIVQLEQATDDAVLRAVNLIRNGVLSNEQLQMLSDALDVALDQRISAQQEAATA